MAVGPGCRFGQPEAGNLWPGIGAAGDTAFIQWMYAFYSRQFFYAEHAFMAGLVRQARCPGHVADGIQPGNTGAAPRVGLDKAFFKLHAQCFEAHVLGIGLDPGRE